MEILPDSVMSLKIDPNTFMQQKKTLTLQGLLDPSCDERNPMN